MTQRHCPICGYVQGVYPQHRIGCPANPRTLAQAASEHANRPVSGENVDRLA